MIESGYEREFDQHVASGRRVTGFPCRRVRYFVQRHRQADCLDPILQYRLGVSIELVGGLELGSGGGERGL